MIPILSLVTSVKDYVEIAHKLIESDSNYSLPNYTEVGSVLTYVLLSIKNLVYDLVSLNWLKNIWNLPIVIPDISSSMISEISILDGYFHNTFNFLDTPISYGSNNGFISSLEKLSIGLINSLFLWLPTSTAHIITLRRFVMQGLEAGYIAGLGTITGSVLWITCIIFGCRFFVIPWLSLDIFRYILGFILLVKYMWDSYNERRMVLEDLSKQKIFLLNFLLALTEQTSIFPFVSNLSIGTETSMIESFPSDSYWQFLSIHGCYILGLVIGSLSLLHFTCWFLENPAFKIYMWLISSFKVSSSFYYKILNFTFLYLTMICAISSVPYYGLDYTLTNPLGFVSEDKILDQKLVFETSFLNTKASDRNTRRNRGRHGRRERWKRRVRKYRTFDASLYDQGIYDLFTIEDLNYGFDKFWLRRKIRNHRVRFRFFPGPWMRSFKKQLAKPRLESYSGPRQEFFRILFEQVYHPSFHEYKKPILNKNNISANPNELSKALSVGNQPLKVKQEKNLEINKKKLIIGLEHNIKNDLIHENSMLRKFVRKVNTRIKTSEITLEIKNDTGFNSLKTKKLNQSIYSKRWKEIFSKLNNETPSPTLKGWQQTSSRNSELKGGSVLKNFYTNSGIKLPLKTNINYENENLIEKSLKLENFTKKDISRQHFSKKDKEILFYRSMLVNQRNETFNQFNSKVFLHPIKFYLQKQKAFERKLRYYTPTVFRKFSIENNAPYFRIMMKRYFYYYKPNLRWERTMKIGSLRKARRKTGRTPRKIQNLEIQNQLLISNETSQQNYGQENSNLNELILKNRIQKPTANYSVVGKKASRYRYQIYKDVLQHWYYSPFNRLLLKLDIDSFIKRQPKSHFLTKQEENLLHLRRFLLAEHYNTLRWYTYMQHYRSMKTKIGGTKSFASRAYNQQFQGTFKKIRHLFAITPSQAMFDKSTNEWKDLNVLKFDQALYNESFNNTKNSLQNNVIIHEELLQNENNSLHSNVSGSPASVKEKDMLPEDFLTQSTNVIREYLQSSSSVKQEYIKKLLQEKNYSELTKFLYKGQKIRGTNPITNQSLLNAQEKDYLLTDKEKNDLNSLAKLRMQNFLRETNLQQDIWVNLLRKWKRKINDQEFLKTYLMGRIEKRERRKQKKERSLKTKLIRLENWLKNKGSSPTLTDWQNNESKQNDNPSMNTGIKKAMIEATANANQLDLKTMNLNERSLWKSNLQNAKSLQNLKFSAELKTENDILNSLNSLSNIIKKLNNNSEKEVGFIKNQQILKKNTLTKVKQLSKNYKEKVSNFLGINKLLIFLKPIHKKDLKNWKNKERALNKQKRARKEFKGFTKKQFKPSMDLPLINQEINGLRKKRDFSNVGTTILEDNVSVEKNKLSFKTLLNDSKKDKNELKNQSFSKISELLFSKDFKRKRSYYRRSRTRRSRGVTRKRTLSESLKREFKNLRRYGETLDNDSKKLKIYQKIHANLSATEEKRESHLGGSFFLNDLKQRRSKQRKQRTWKTKRSKYAQKLRKYRQRRRYGLSKIRVLNKKLKRIQSKIQIQNWWWKQFLPSLQATTDSLWQIEKDRQIEEKLSQLAINQSNLKNDVQFSNLNSSAHLPSNSEIITNSLSTAEGWQKTLQIGDYDFKPLSINLNSNLNSDKKVLSDEKIDSNVNATKDTLIGKISENLLTKSNSGPNQMGSQSNVQKNYLINTTAPPLPFYAGWDESLRKFIVTNRFLSRRDSGYQMNLNNLKMSDTLVGNDSLVNSTFENKDTIVFNSAPLKGMNAATTLYWQIPFTTYDPDQFFALGMDGFAPLHWRRFQFRHTILKTWLYDSENHLNKQNKAMIIKKKVLRKDPTVSTTTADSTLSNINENFLYKIKEKTYVSLKNNQNAYSQSFALNNILQNKKNNARRLKKRYRRVKKHPRSPVWFPSGPLLNEVLPVHYIYVFYKRARLPRDRYLKRRLGSISQMSNSVNNNIKSTQNNLIGESFKNINTLDFTLRKRVKTKRDYHRKRYSNNKSEVLPKRLKFVGDNFDSMRWRPLSMRRFGLTFNLPKNQSMEEFTKEQINTLRLKTKQSSSSKQKDSQPTNLLRVKQLRRRVQRQIIRSVWRYKPRAGGFVWPGDYLQLELVKAPTLQILNKKDKDKLTQEKINKQNLQTRKIKRKKKRTISEWQIQPKKYLLEKHNLKVIKTKLEKANRSNKIKQKIKELNYII